MTRLAEEFVVGLVTVPDEELAHRIGKDLLERKLAACIQRVAGVDSLFRWEGRVDRAGEQLLLIKTRRAHVDAVIERVRANHPYRVPEVLFLPVIAGNPDYVSWLDEETRA